MSEKIKRLIAESKALSMQQKKVSEALREAFPIGSVVHVVRGNGIWRGVEIVGYGIGSHCAYFTGKAKTGNNFRFHFCEIEWIGWEALYPK